MFLPSAAEILRRYWGYDSFRPMQREIIDSVLAGNDTLALLPTGGGKSVTFQVPAMILPGLTVVVTPLISLMKDQVDNLLERGIRAAAVHSGLSRAENRLALDRCRLGKIKLLYLSPEKLQSESFIDQLASYHVSLIVVDEAHCISQWGYDFRPSYLKIEALRKHFPNAPVLALTASATPEVARDIMHRLAFRSPSIFSRSFSRPNISYVVRHCTDKMPMLLRVLRNTSGSAIVYVRSRQRTKRIASDLQRQGISADHYHAGLDAEEKNQKQNLWKSGATRVIVATNAFGMGIDKPDVRTVVHFDLPSSLEEYYQESGRAGRDGHPSFAVVLAAASDKATLTRRLSVAFPDKEAVRRVYELVGNFLDVAVGSGYGMLYEFSTDVFCSRFSLDPAMVRSALALLTRAGWLEYVDEVSTRSRVMVIMDKRELYQLDLDPVTDRVFQYLLRSYTGLFADFVHISESQICSELMLSADDVYRSLLNLTREHAISFIPRKTTPYIYYPTSRELPKYVQLPPDVYERQKERMKVRIDAMRSFVFDSSRCRVRGMLEYFGEKNVADCGKCDVCRSRSASSHRHSPESQLHLAVLRVVADRRWLTLPQLSQALSIPVHELLPVVRTLLDSRRIVADGRRIGFPSR